jgi:hypothetical protein
MVFTCPGVGKKILKIGALFIAFHKKTFRQEGFFIEKYSS